MMSSLKFHMLKGMITCQQKICADNGFLLGSVKGTESYFSLIESALITSLINCFLFFIIDELIAKLVFINFIFVRV